MDGYILRPASPIWAGSVWAARDGEVGDLCESEASVAEGAYRYDPFWSNTRAATLTVTAPADAAPGAWALVEIRSSAGSERHAWPVGFYVSPHVRN